MVENDFAETATDVRELRKKDTKALLVLQQAVADPIFPQIAGVTKSKETETILKQAFHGGNKITTVKL